MKVESDFNVYATLRQRTTRNRPAILAVVLPERLLSSQGKRVVWPTTLEAKQRWLEAWLTSRYANEKYALALRHAERDPEWNVALLTWRHREAVTP